MSRKRRKDQSEKANEITTLDLSSHKNTVEKSEIEPANSVPSKFGIFTYLKTHLWLVGIICFLALGALGAGLKFLDEDAQREIARRNQKNNLNNQKDQSFLNKVNPFLSPPDPTPTPQLSKELIYAGGRLLAVEDKNASAPPIDLAIWRPGDGNWWIMSGNGSQQVTQGWGLPTDKPVPGDYDGDGKTDFAVFRPSNGYWYVIYSSNSTTSAFAAGSSTDKPVPADYDGDGRTDIAYWTPGAPAVWTIIVNGGSSYFTYTLGTTGDVPAPADYDGDGKADAAVFRPASPGSFYYLKSTDLQTISTTGVGTTGDVPVPGDYDGDGKADIAFWTGGSGSSSGSWKYYLSSGGSPVTVTIGIGTDSPIQNDYDGDGKTDMAVFRGANSPGLTDAGTWLIRNSSNPSPLRTEHWGAAGDKPVPAFWKRQ